MDTRDPNTVEETDEPKVKSKETSNRKPLNIDEDDYLDPTDEDRDPAFDDNDDDDVDDDDVKPNNLKFIIIGIVILVLGAAIYFLFFRGGDEPKDEQPLEQNAEIPTTSLEEQLANMGIGKGAKPGGEMYMQGNLESKDFRKDFSNQDAPENYVQPVKITAVTDSVSYTKHRTMTDDGMDMYWVDAQYKGKVTRFTIPYYIWQTLSPEGVMDVYVEVITDADGRVFIGSLTAVPPSE